MNEIDTAWLAGLLEGEGCFAFSRTPKIVLSMTDEDIVQRVASLFETPYRSYQPKLERRKMVFITEVHGEKALKIMRGILPLMGSRRSQKIADVMACAAARLGVAKGERNGHALLSDLQAKSIFDEYHSSAQVWGAQSRLAEKYGLSSVTVSNLVGRRTYSNATLGK